MFPNMDAAKGAQATLDVLPTPLNGNAPLLLPAYDEPATRGDPLTHVPS
jgi:hypothetical protein